MLEPCLEVPPLGNRLEFRKRSDVRRYQLGNPAVPLAGKELPDLGKVCVAGDESGAYGPSRGPGNGLDLQLVAGPLGRDKGVCDGQGGGELGAATLECQLDIRD